MNDIEGLPEPAAPDWWQASNDLWYPPATHPDGAKPPPPSPQPGPPSPPAPAGWQSGAVPPPQQPGYSVPNQQFNGPGQPAPAPAKKGTNPLLIILGVIGLLFILGLGGCAVAGVFAAVRVGSAIDEAADNISEVTEGIDGEGGIGELLDEDGAIGGLLDEEGGIGGLLDEAAQFGVCVETIGKIENQSADGQLDLVDDAIEQCGTLPILELALAEQTELLENGQTIRELVEERCTAPDTPLSNTRICQEIDGSG